VYQGAQITTPSLGSKQSIKNNGVRGINGLRGKAFDKMKYNSIGRDEQITHNE